MEKAHDISIDEPCVAHQAILFMLDVLMRNNKPTLALAELYDSFGDKSFTPQMLRAVGGNEQGLRQFLLRYPSLFTVNGDSISANSGGNQLPRTSSTPERYLRKPKPAKTTTSNTETSNGTSVNSDGISSSSSSSNSSGDLINSSSSSTSSSSSSSSANPSNSLATGQTSQNSASLSTVEQPQYDSKTMKEIEQEAIAFFRKQISKREEDWLPIVSVAGHASQSSSDVRKYVGPQNEFKSFLLKYPHIFVVRDEYCGLKGKADVSTAPFPPPSPPPKRRIQNSISIIGNPMMSGSGGGGVGGGGVGVNASLITRNHSLRNNTNRYSACGNLMPNATNGCLNPSVQQGPNGMVSGNTNSLMCSSNLNMTGQLNGGNGATVVNPSTGMSKPRLTPVEVKAVHYVMRILHKNGRMLLQTIPGLISRAPDQVSNIVGFTREDLIQFFKRHSAIFQLHPDGCVSVKQDAVKALILKDASGGNGSAGGAGSNSNGAQSNSADGGGAGGTVITNSGVVLRIFPKYGILNMENNEQVFFDIQSCQFETFSDLTTILHTGDKLYFNAIIGPRDGSTKWRSLKTWIKMKPQQQSNICLLENLSSHSDADKSDDSSTSSLNGVGGSGGYANINGSFSRNSQHRNTNANPQLANNSGYLNQAILYQNGAGQAGSSNYYMVNNNSNSVTPTQFTNAVGQQQVVMTANNSSSSPTNSHMIMNQSISSLSIDENSVLTCTSEVASSSAAAAVMNSSGSMMGSHHATLVSSNSGDFNQYQLESGDYSQSTANSTPSTPIGPADSDLSDLSNHSSSLIHSSSATNLQLFQNNTLQQSTSTSSNNNKPNALISSNSIHSFNLLTSSSIDSSGLTDGVQSMMLGNGGKKINDDKNSPPATNPNTITKFMKQSADNISQREILIVNPSSTSSSSSSSSTTSTEMISIGCQTISTGDITVTNVYIE